MEFLQALKNRRSIYNLGTNVNLSNEEITSIISDCLKYSPSAFNYPTTNVIIAFGEKHQQIWQITTDILKEKLAKKKKLSLWLKIKSINSKLVLALSCFLKTLKSLMN